jgi:opacity protein-like surface antigen
MKRAILAVILVLGLAAAGFALELGLNFQYGARTVADSKIKDVYGNGTAYFPSIRLVEWKGLEVGAGYEAGYKRNGVIGLYQEKTTLRITGYEVFAGYGYRLKIMEPYLRLGCGWYAYKQTIESESMPVKIEHKKSGLTLAAGARVYPLARIHLSLEAKYVALKVKPIDQEVDLSGWRLTLGLGYSFCL